MDILIVDDSPSICMVSTYAIAADSHTVTTYPTGEEAVAGYLTKQATGAQLPSSAATRKKC